MGLVNHPTIWYLVENLYLQDLEGQLQEAAHFHTETLYTTKKLMFLFNYKFDHISYNTLLHA